MATKHVKKIGSLPIEKAQMKYLRGSRDTIEEIAENSLNHFLKGFQRGGYQTDESRGGWKPRKSTDSGRALLVKTGALRRDIDVQSISKDRIVIGTNRVPYAAVHNEGGDVPTRYPRRRKALKFTIGGRTIFAKSVKGFKMPKRQFIGESETLNNTNTETIKDFLDRILRA